MRGSTGHRERPLPVAHVQLNGGQVVQGMRVVQAYTDTHLPDTGHTAWGWYNGKIMMLYGRQIVPPGAVAF